MSNNQFISVRETAQLLAITEKGVMDLIETRKLQAYRIADKFLRLKKSEVLNLRNSEKVDVETVPQSYTPTEKLTDFLYYNDFYLFSAIFITILLYIIFRT